jgi:hypothetical protein
LPWFAKLQTIATASAITCSLDLRLQTGEPYGSSKPSPRFEGAGFFYSEDLAEERTHLDARSGSRGGPFVASCQHPAAPSQRLANFGIELKAAARRRRAWDTRAPKTALVHFRR